MKKTVIYNEGDWEARTDRFWSVCFNTISGPRSVFMIGTQDEHGVGNIGLFNSIVHIGANPPLLGFILRPTTVKRHTYENIKSNGCYTLNHSTPDLVEQTHQSAAKYARDVDEFDALGFKKQHLEGFNAPFIEASRIKLGLHFKEEHLIEANDTRLIVGEVTHVIIDEDLIKSDGFVDTAEAETLLVSGLDAYHRHSLIERKPYARP